MLHEFKIRIDKSPEDVFRFLCDKNSYKQQKGSPVLLLDKTTPETIGIGTGYREVVQMAPFIKSEILSQITGFETNSILKELKEYDGFSERALAAIEHENALDLFPRLNG